MTLSGGAKATIDLTDVTIEPLDASAPVTVTVNSATLKVGKVTDIDTSGATEGKSALSVEVAAIVTAYNNGEIDPNTLVSNLNGIITEYEDAGATTAEL